MPAHSSTPIILKYFCCNCSGSCLKRLQAATASYSKRGTSNLRQNRQKASFLMLRPAYPSLLPLHRKDSISFCFSSQKPRNSTSHTMNSPFRWPSVLAKSSISLQDAWQVSFSIRQTSITQSRMGLSLMICELSSCASIFLKVEGEGEGLLLLRPQCAASTRSSILLSRQTLFFLLKNSSKRERNSPLRIFSREVQAFHKLKLLSETVLMDSMRKSLKYSSGNSSRLTSEQGAQCSLILRKMEMILSSELVLACDLMTVTMVRNFHITDLLFPQLLRITQSNSKRKLQRLVRETFRQSERRNLLRYFYGFWTERPSSCFIRCLRIRSQSCSYLIYSQSQLSRWISCSVFDQPTTPMCSLLLFSQLSFILCSRLWKSMLLRWLGRLIGTLMVISSPLPSLSMAKISPSLSASDQMDCISESIASKCLLCYYSLVSLSFPFLLKLLRFGGFLYPLPPLSSARPWIQSRVSEFFRESLCWIIRFFDCFCNCSSSLWLITWYNFLSCTPQESSLE